MLGRQLAWGKNACNTGEGYQGGLYTFCNDAAAGESKRGVFVHLFGEGRITFLRE